MKAKGILQRKNRKDPESKDVEALSTHRVWPPTRAGALKLPPPPRPCGLAERGGGDLRLWTWVRHRQAPGGTAAPHHTIFRRGKEGLKGVVESRHEEERPAVTRVRLWKRRKEKWDGWKIDCRPGADQTPLRTPFLTFSPKKYSQNTLFYILASLGAYYINMIGQFCCFMTFGMSQVIINNKAILIFAGTFSPIWQHPYLFFISGISSIYTWGHGLAGGPTPPPSLTVWRVYSRWKTLIRAATDAKNRTPLLRARPPGGGSNALPRVVFPSFELYSGTRRRREPAKPLLSRYNLELPLRKNQIDCRAGVII